MATPQPTAPAPEKAPPADNSGMYVVYAVDNADRLTLVSSKTPVVTKNIILTGLIAPKIARMGNQGELIPDEPCAFDSREYVRKKVIGKTIKFIHDSTIEALQRDAGRISLQDGEDIGVSLVMQGLASVQPSRGPKEYIQLLFAAQEEAKKKTLGVWGTHLNTQVRQLKPAPPEDAEALLKVMKGETQKVLIERVLTGSSFIGTLTAYNQQITLNLTGIVCPQVRGTPEPFAVEAKTHTERCLLHREVNVEFDAVNNFKVFLGSVVSGGNVFQMDLLARGYAKVLGTSINNSSHRDRMRAAEKTAQDNHVGIWKDYVPTQILQAEDPATAKASGPEFQGDKQFEAQVIQIVSGDTVVLLRGSQSIKATIASVRANRLITRDQEPGKEARVVYENYTWEAREALRTLCIGKTVHVSVDYCRVIEETKEVRPHVTLVLADSGENVGVHLVSLGYARVFVSKTEAACCAELLREAENIARAKKLGIHSTKESQPMRVFELARPGEKKARQHLGFFQRGGNGGRPPRLAAVVDMVLAPTSLKVFITKERTQITLKLAGVACPSQAQGDQPADPFADEAKMFALTKLQNHDVEVEVETVDKFGNFLGSLYIGNQNFAVLIVKAGLGCVGNVDRLTYASELRAAEKKAQESRLCIWSEGSHVPAKVQKAQARALKASPGVLVPQRAEAFTPVMLTEIINSSTFYICQLDEATKASRKAIEKALETYKDPGVRYFTTKKEEIVLARFSQDGKWYRGRVASYTMDKRLATIRFIDYGNSEERCEDDIRQVTDPFLSGTPALATEGHVAYIKPVTSDIEDAAADGFRTYCSVDSLFARSEYTIGEILHYTITGDPNGETAVQYLIRNGLGILDPRAILVEDPAIKATVVALQPLQQAAQKAGRNVWQFGTAIADEDDA